MLLFLLQLLVWVLFCSEVHYSQFCFQLVLYLPLKRAQKAGSSSWAPLPKYT